MLVLSNFKLRKMSDLRTQHPAEYLWMLLFNKVGDQLIVDKRLHKE